MGNCSCFDGLRQSRDARRGGHDPSDPLGASPACASSSVCTPSRRGTQLQKFFTARSSSFTDIVRSVGSGVASKPTRSNANVPTDYLWTMEILQSIASCRADCLGCTCKQSGEAWTPIFVILGACPNRFAPIQGLLFTASAQGKVEFWWIKPDEGKNKLERETLHRHDRGPHKNDPGRSKAAFQGLADLFESGASSKSKEWSYGICHVEPQASRASGEQPAAGGGGEKKPSNRRAFFRDNKLPEDERFYVYMVWVEEWSANLLWGDQYVKGNILYQKDVGENTLFARQYNFKNGVMHISERESGPIHSLVPGTDIKDLRSTL